MNKTDLQRLRLLTERFDEGLTTNAEEREIYRAYARHRRLPADLERLRPLFTWYSALGSPRPEAAPATRPRMLWLRVAASAAVLAALVTVGADLLGRGGDMADLTGGYVIRNGVKYTGAAQIEDAMAEALRLADIPRDAVAEALQSQMPLSTREIVAAYVDMDDPGTRAVIDRVLPEN